MMVAGKKIRVLVVDDSVLVRKTVTEFIGSAPDLEVVATAANGQEALDAVAQLRPDVVSLDLNMPVMDGMSCLAHLIKRFQQRVVILSTLARESSFMTFKALALGAIDFVTKPGAGQYLSSIDELGAELVQKIRAAAAVPSSKIGVKSARPSQTPRLSVSANAPVVSIGKRMRSVVGVGGSTGGAVALEELLQHIPTFLPVSLVMVQHIPQGFSCHFARYLDSVSGFDVQEAVDGQILEPHCAYLAPGGAHLRIQATHGHRGPADKLVLRLDHSGRPNAGFRPSINTLFYSLATCQRHRAIGILLSGLGEDGVSGLAAVRRLGGKTLVQDEPTSVVFDMGARAVAAGVADEVLPPTELAGAVHRALRGGSSQPKVVNG